MKTKAEQYVAKMEESDILMTEEMTFVEYSDSLVQFQNMITKLVMGEEYEEGMRIDEAIYRLEAKARAKGINNASEFRKGIIALKKVSKEIAISMAGRKGENIVAKTLKYVARPNTTMYRNLYVSDEKEETELDNVVLTNEGIIILEIKNTKDDVTITEQGRLVHSGNECYDKQPLGVKMQKKRRLLKEKLETIMAEKNINIPIRIESLIVFSSPNRINVDDRFHREKWCHRTVLRHKIEEYVGLTYYNEEQLSILNSALSEIETQAKRFELTLNFNEIRNDIAEALAMFDEETVNEQALKVKENINIVTKKQQRNIFDAAEKFARNFAKKKIVAVMVGTVTSAACVGAIGVAAITGRK